MEKIQQAIDKSCSLNRKCFRYIVQNYVRHHRPGGKKQDDPSPNVVLSSALRIFQSKPILLQKFVSNFLFFNFRTNDPETNSLLRRVLLLGDDLKNNGDGTDESGGSGNNVFGYYSGERSDGGASKRRRLCFNDK